MLDAIDALGPPARPGASLIPSGQRLDLFVTLTDYHGRPELLELHDPQFVHEREHRHVLHFGYRRNQNGVAENDFDLANGPGLAFAARATSSFPGAFPPARIVDLDAAIARRGIAWPKRQNFIEKGFGAYLESDVDPTEACFIDGGVLNNRPFREAISAIQGRPAYRQIDRRLVYIDPLPDSVAYPHVRGLAGLSADAQGGGLRPSARSTDNGRVERTGRVQRSRAQPASHRRWSTPAHYQACRRRHPSSPPKAPLDGGADHELATARQRAGQGGCRVRLRELRSAQAALRRQVGRSSGRGSAWDKSAVAAREDHRIGSSRPGPRVPASSVTTQRTPPCPRRDDAWHRVRDGCTSCSPSTSTIASGGCNSWSRDRTGSTSSSSRGKFPGLEPHVVDNLKRAFYAHLDVMDGIQARCFSAETREEIAALFAAAPPTVKARDFSGFRRAVRDDARAAGSTPSCRSLAAGNRSADHQPRPRFSAVQHAAGGMASRCALRGARQLRRLSLLGCPDAARRGHPPGR